MAPSAELAGVEALVASAELVGVEALFASAERVGVAAAVLPLPAGSLEAGVCLPRSQTGAPFLVVWGPLLAAGEVYRLAVDGADPHWDVALPLV